MRDGVVMQVADPLTLYRRPQNLFVAGFIGSPPMSLLPGRVESRDGRLVFVGDGGDGALTVPLTGRLEQLARGRIGRKIVFGLRPDHLNVAGEAATHAPASCLIEMAEPMGAESILYLKAGGSSLIGRVPGEHLYKKGEKLTMHLHLEKAHLFDAESEIAITET